MQKKTSNKSLEDFYKEEWTQEPYKDMTLEDIYSSEEPDSMWKAKQEQAKVRSYYDRLKQKLRGE